MMLIAVPIIMMQQEITQVMFLEMIPMMMAIA